MAGRETPRQKLIAMMYLVLTALLALNLSKDVINAFVVVNDTVKKTNLNLSHKLDDIYDNFEKNYMFDGVKVKPHWDKAVVAQELSTALVSYLTNIRNEVVAVTAGISIDSASKVSIKDIAKKDNFDIPTAYFLGSSSTGAGSVASDINQQINSYHKEIKELANEAGFKNFKTGLEIKGPYYSADGMKESWETHFFYHTILAADVTILNKLISDVRNTEFDLVNSLHKLIGKDDFKFDKIEAKILPESKYVLSGDEYKAEIIVAAYDTSQIPEVYFMEDIEYMYETQIRDANLIKSSSGKIDINFRAFYPGRKTYAGIVRVKTGSGNIQDYHFTGEYQVVSSSYSISAKKMNVFYVGVSNPVSIDISGIPRSKIIPTISCGYISDDPYSGDWIVNVPNGCRETNIKLNAYVNGELRYLGSKRFRVKKLPSPKATIANKSSGFISSDILIAAGAIIPRMPDDFDFASTFVVSSFSMSIQRGFKIYSLESKSAYLTSEMVDHIRRSNRGQSIVFENIVTRDSEGLEREISPIVLTIN